MSYQEYLHQKLQKMALLERVQANSKQIQTIHRLNYESSMTLLKKFPAEEITFDHDSWAKLTKENIEKDFVWQMEDRQQKKEKAFKAIQARSFEKASMMALYGADSLETYEESSGL